VNVNWKRVLKVAVVACVVLAVSVYAFEMYFAQSLGYANLLL
jgi:negative regulator of sigma E activity